MNPPSWIPLAIDAVFILHFLWILFLIFGFYFVLKGSRIACIHVSGLLFSLVLNLMGWYCPLTHLEDHLNSLQGPGTPVGKSFLKRNLEKVVYPDLDESWIRRGEIVFVVVNGVAYVWAIAKGKVRKKAPGIASRGKGGAQGNAS